MPTIYKLPATSYKLIMNTLFINTATEMNTISLFTGNQLIAEKRWPCEHHEAETLQPSIDRLLREQLLNPEDIDRLVVCVGPGGFTSTRLGVSAGNAWSFALETPIAAVTVFDLYQDPEAAIVVSANANEAWVKVPGKEPHFYSQEKTPLMGSFLFTGILHPSFQSFLQNRGGTYKEVKEKLPPFERFDFTLQPIKPWYYKEAHITWSHKIPWPSTSSQPPSVI